MRKNYLGNWLPSNRCRWCCFWRMQEACGRAQMYCMVHFYLVIAFSSYSWSFEVVTFLWAFWRASTLLLVQCTYNFSKKLKFTEVCFVLKVFFFWHESQLNILIHIQPNMLIMNITILEIGIIKLFYFMCRWLSIREKSIQCKIWRWKALLWRRMVCGSVTDIYLLICDRCVHMTMTIKTKSHT